MNPKATDTRLTCLLFNDLEAWERCAIEPILQEISKSIKVHQIAVTETERKYFKNRNLNGDFWILSRNWYQALQFLGANQYRKGKVYTSVFHGSSETRALHTLIYKELSPTLSGPIRLLVHSLINQKFFTEIGHFPKEKISLVPLVIPDFSTTFATRAEGEKLHVGTFCEFSTENNINYFLGVAHYVCHANANANFRILGRGPHYAHFVRMVNEMGLHGRVSVVETVQPTDVACLDLLLYTPLRNHHFIPVLCAAAYEIPVLSLEIPGIGELIKDGHTGFIVSVNEIKPMGELVLRMLQNAHVRVEMGKKLHRELSNQLAPANVASEYLKIFSPTANQTQTPIETAA